MTENISNKKLLTQLVIRLENKKNYFSYQEIKALLEKEKINITQSSLKSYVFELTKNRVIFDAGKGWYSSIKEPFELNTKPVKPIIRKIKKEFPLLEFSCWSTEQLNPFTHHLMAKFITFVYVEFDHIPALANLLDDADYSVHRNPTKSEITKFFKITDKTIVLLPSITKQPKSINKAAPIEKILIDFLMENRHFKIMDEPEAETVVLNALNSGRINMATLVSYAKRRKFNLPEVINQLHVNSIGGNS